MHTEIIVKSLSYNLFRFINIDDSPILALSTTIPVDNNLISLIVFATINFKCFTVLPVDELSNSVYSLILRILILNLLRFILEDLEPS